jgi:citrate synthase
MSDKKARISLAGNQDSIELPVLNGSIGPDVIDVRSLVSHGVFTYDPGFMSTASTESSITYIDGDEGMLLHRGYPIDQLADHSDYLETCYLLLHGELPNPTEKKSFVAEITRHTMVDAQIAQLLNGFQRNAHPMAVLISLTGALAALYHEGLDVDDPVHRRLAAIRLIAKMPTLAAI